MSEEQGAAVEAGESVQTGTQEQGTENQTGEETKLFNQEAANNAFTRQRQELVKYKREAAQLVEDKRKIQEQLAGFQATSAPVVPPIPDQYDEDFDRKMRERDEAMTRKHTHDNQQESLRLNEQNTKQQTEQQAKDVQQKVVSTFTTRTTEFGLDPNEMDTAANTIMNYGVTDQLADYILKDPDGPLILKHLASNPMQLSELASMDPMSASAKIENVIRAEAQKLKPKQSQTPDPGMIINGNGVPEAIDPLLEGCKIE